MINKQWCRQVRKKTHGNAARDLEIVLELSVGLGGKCRFFGPNGVINYGRLKPK